MCLRNSVFLVSNLGSQKNVDAAHIFPTADLIDNYCASTDDALLACHSTVNGLSLHVWVSSPPAHSLTARCPHCQEYTLPYLNGRPHRLLISHRLHRSLHISVPRAQTSPRKMYSLHSSHYSVAPQWKITLPTNFLRGPEINTACISLSPIPPQRKYSCKLSNVGGATWIGSSKCSVRSEKPTLNSSCLRIYPLPNVHFQVICASATRLRCHDQRGRYSWAPRALWSCGSSLNLVSNFRVCSIRQR